MLCAVFSQCYVQSLVCFIVSSSPLKRLVAALLIPVIYIHTYVRLLDKRLMVDLMQITHPLYI